MKKIIISAFCALVTLASCEKFETVKEVNTDFKTNFDTFWTMIDEQYSFLDYKNIDWDAVYDEMLPRVEAAQTEQQFFNVLESSLDYLRDGHVWMRSPFKYYGCTGYLYNDEGERYPVNYYSSLVSSNYLNEAFITWDNNVRYGVIERDGHKYTYIYYSQFTKDWTDREFAYLQDMIDSTEGIILDIRNNPGGGFVWGVTLAGHFFDEKTLVGYNMLKGGTGHSDFMEPSPIYVTPSKTNNWADKKTILLTNRDVYSTANYFTNMLKHAKNVTQIGGITGGGGGLPTTQYLPNGWLVVFSTNTILDSNKEHVENGIAPDIEVTITDADVDAGRDTIIERALEELMK